MTDPIRVHQSEYDLTTRERELIMTDILCYYAELQMNDPVTDDKWDETVESVKEMEGDDEMLVDYWIDTVAEWVLSREDVMKQYEDDHGLHPEGDEIASEELHRLLHPDKETTYGYVMMASEVRLDDNRDEILREYGEKYSS